MTEQFIGLQHLIEDGEMDETALQDTLEALEGDIQVKAEGLLGYVANIGSDVTAIDSEIKRLQARKKVMTNNQERLRNYLRDNMAAADIKKITCPLFSITLRKPSAMVSIIDESLIPDEFIVTTTRPNKAVIKTALMLDTPVPGCRLVSGQPGLLIK
jgi:hypothetical protein